MTKDKKNFNIYVFLSTFARNLIEVFIPMILYKNGYSLKEVMTYYFFVNLFSLFLAYPCLKIAKKFNYRILSFIGIMAFSIMQVLLNNIEYSMSYIIIISFMFALYRRGYWISRRFYNLNIIGEKNISMSYTIISIINQLGVMISAYIGGILLDFISINVLTVISITLFCVSTIPLFFIKIEDNNKDKNMELRKTLKEIKFDKLYLFGSYELLNVIKFLFTLYIAIYVKNTYQTVGILNIISNLAILFFTYTYGKKINGNKNYLKLSIFLVVITYLLKANITSYLLIVISLIEGFTTKMYEISINKEFYKLSKNMDYEKYNFAYECTQNFARTILVGILLLITNNVKIMIYVSLAIITLGMLFYNNTNKKTLNN